MHDLIIRGARVFDGLGNPGIDADVAVSGGRVAAIGNINEGAKSVVDADGLALMPGIVDLHTHYDAQITWDRTMSPSPALGVTTAVIGNCGFGIAPCPAPLRETMVKNLSVVEGMDPRGFRYFWFGLHGIEHTPGHASDLEAIADGYVAVTPLQLDFTHEASLTSLAERYH